MKPIVDRVRKLIALSGSANEHESRSAARLACKLIREHNLHVDHPEGDQGRAPVGRAPVPTRRRATKGPYTRSATPLVGRRCRECSELIADRDVCLDAEGLPVHGDCIPSVERP